MARLREGERVIREEDVRRLLHQYDFGLREWEIAQELGWHRRTVNNYLRKLAGQGRVYKEGRCWLADDG
jgi:Mn-dependent DtxR family transcriptional regulator